MLPLTPSAPALLAPLFAKKCSSRCCWFGRLLLPMVLVRLVARPDAAGSAGCASRCCWFGRLLLPKVPCFALWSCFPMVLCAVPGGSCFSMMPERLPRRISHASAPAERQPLPHRLPLRSIPPAALRLRAPPIHEGHGRPRSVRKSSRLRWKHHLPSCSFARPGCSLIRPRCTRLLAKPEYFPAE